MPWLGKPFIGIDNYVEAFGDPRFWAALGHTAFFAVTSVGLELIIGLWLALALNRAFRGRGLVRAAVLVPWAIPTVVSALLWRFMFEGQEFHGYATPEDRLGLCFYFARQFRRQVYVVR